MNIRYKLNLGIGFLFALILLLGTVGIWYINALKNDAQNILTDNYQSLQYTSNMLKALNRIHTDPEESMQEFEQNLQRQQTNITENGEAEATKRLVEHYKKLKQSPGQSNLYSFIREDIFEIIALNMQAIEQKDKIASQTAQTATIWMATVGGICFLIAFTLLINLPNSILQPIAELTESIKQITSKNYGQRVYFKGQGEFKELAHSFNIMAERLEEYHNSNLYDLLLEKKTYRDPN